MEKTKKIPGPDHPITISAEPSLVTVKIGTEVVARTTRALRLKEAQYPAVYYIPRADVRMDLLVPSDHSTYCPYKGECSYFSIPLGGTRSINAVWTYEAPFDAVEAIRDCLAFYPDRVDAILAEPPTQS